jgi:alpha-beta hydrolase superfamily lysophospholipase
MEIIRTDAPGPVATIVLIHGAWHGAWCWHDGFAQRLADRGISTIAPSLRGHAGSAERVRLNRLRMRDYADDLTAVINDLEAPPFIAGHSMGGGVVQGFLERTVRPAIAGAALLASMPPRGVIGVTLQVARRTPGTFLVSNATLNLGRLAATEAQVRELFFRPETSASVVTATTARVQSESYLAFMDMLVLDRPKPRPVDVPLLVLGAGDDAIFTRSEVAATAQAWGTKPLMIHGIGHDVMLDDGWEQVADALADWVLAERAVRSPDGSA